MNRAPRALVFDWDCTLIDSEARIVTCFVRTAEELGLPVLAREQVREVIGLGLAEALAALFPEADAKLQEAIVATYRRHFLSPEIPPSPLYPGVPELLEDLRGRGYRLAIATGKSRAGIERELRLHRLEGAFEAVRTADQSRSKPHPQMLLEVLDALRVGPPQAVMIGDTVYDVEMAVRARVPALGVSYGVHAPERLLQAGALACLEDLNTLPEWLERNQQAVAAPGSSSSIDPDRR